LKSCSPKYACTPPKYINIFIYREKENYREEREKERVLERKKARKRKRDLERERLSRER